MCLFPALKCIATKGAAFNFLENRHQSAMIAWNLPLDAWPEVNSMFIWLAGGFRSFVSITTAIWAQCSLVFFVIYLATIFIHRKHSSIVNRRGSFIRISLKPNSFRMSRAG
jgi:hypothetical protein